MFKSYLKVAIRNLRRSKGFSLMNILGLSIGMASALIILLWVENEWSFDRYYPHQSRLYTVWNKDKWGNELMCWGTTPKVFGTVLKQEYPEIEKSSRVNWDQTLLFSLGEKRLNVTGTMVDSDFLAMFSVPFIRGDAATALNTPYSIVLTQKLAKKLFGNENPIGRIFKIDNKNNVTVTGVIGDLPNNTRFDYEFLLPWSYMKVTGQDDSYWGNNSTKNYVLLKPNTDIAVLNEKIKDLVARHTGPGETERQFLYPVNREHLYSNFKDGKQAGGRIEMVRAFLILAIFILLIACINFMNLSTARSEKRAKEVGIRKTVGARKQSLVIQFLAESLMISVIAGVLALLIVQLCLPSFNILTRKELVIAYGSPVFWLSFLGFILFTGILAGSYPAFFLSAFKPVQVLKGGFKKVNALVTPRRALVVIQFTFAIILIISTVIIQQQLKYAQNRESGYDRSKLVYVMMEGDIYKNATLIKNELLAQGIATAVSNTSSPLTESWSNTGSIGWQGKAPDDKTIINRYSSDGNLAKTAGMQIILGRDIDLPDFPTDSMAAVMNEAAVKAMGFKNPLGQVLKDDTTYHVVGVVKDFIIESPFEPIRPMVIFGPRMGYNVIHIKLSPAHSTAYNIAAMEKIFKRHNPEYPFQYKFLDEEYANKFKEERMTETLAALFAGLTIFISCLGLFGLAAYMAENRIKEIGVRKVLGASVLNITTLLSRDFIVLVLIAIVIASPIAWYAMGQWLKGYPFHITISAWIFILAGLLAILVSLITVSYQAIKAALANPVKSLRSE
jgi:putative ABC transport system permease protein